jgi:hypothetical protein
MEMTLKMKPSHRRSCRVQSSPPTRRSPYSHAESKVTEGRLSEVPCGVQANAGIPAREGGIGGDCPRVLTVPVALGGRLADDLVRLEEERWGDGETQSPGSLEVDDELEFGRPLDG